MDLYFELTITKVDNGYAACFWEEGATPEAEPVKTVNVFEALDSEHGDIECFQRLLWYVTEHFGMYGSKHDAKRIRINIEEQS